MVPSPHPAVTCGHNESTKHALVINCRGRKYTSHTTLYNDIILWLNMVRDKSSPGSASLLLLQQPISSEMFRHDCLKSHFVLTYDPIVLLKYVYLRLFKYIIYVQYMYISLRWGHWSHPCPIQDPPVYKKNHGSSTAAGAEASLVWPSGVERCLTLPEGFLGYRGLKFWHLSGFHINHMNHHQTTMVGCQPTVFQRWWQYIYQSAGFLCSFRFTVFWAVSLTIRNLQDSTSLFLLAKLHGFSPTKKNVQSI